jgi:hypothetical protein
MTTIDRGCKPTHEDLRASSVPGTIRTNVFEIAGAVANVGAGHP